jgi:hypothetical protein
MYEQFVLGNLPSFLNGKWGKRWFGAIGTTIDEALKGALQGVFARYVRHAPQDALAYYAEDVRIPRFRFDTPGELRERLQDPWGFWGEVGVEEGIRNVLGILGFGTGALDTCFWDAKSGFTFDGSSWWSRWWVLARQNHDYTLHTTWDVQTGLGTTWDDATDLWTWDCTAPGDVVAQARAYLWEYKWPGGVPIAMYVKFGTGSLWDEWLFLGPNNTWDWANGDGLTWDEAGAASRVVWELGQLWDYDVSENGASISWDAAEQLQRRWGGRHRMPLET